MSGKELRSYEDVKGTRDVRKSVKLRQSMVKKNVERQGQRVVEGRDPDYLAWVPTQPSVVSGVRPGEPVAARGMLRGWRPAKMVPAHMKHGRTADCDQTALPLEWWEHEEMHRIGIKSWAKKHNLDIPALIAQHRKRYALEMAEKAAAKK